MLTVALEYRKVDASMCADRDLGLRKYELGAREWTIAHQLTDVLKVRVQTLILKLCSAPELTNLNSSRLPHMSAPLLSPRLVAIVATQVFKDATYFFSRGTPNLATVIPAMDLIDQQLATKHLQTAKYDFAIRTAMGLAKKTLNKYYELTDASKAYRIAMGMSCLIISVFHPLMHAVLQCFIRVTRRPTLRRSGGSQSGLTSPRTSSTRSSTRSMQPSLWIPTARTAMATRTMKRMGATLTLARRMHLATR